MTIWHCHVAVSLDGKIARPDGGVEDWLVADYPPEGLGFEEFYAAVDVILMGRGTYDAVRGPGGWSYADKQVFVLTSQALTDLPPGVHVRRDLDALIAEIEAAGHALAWIEGGGQVLSAMIARDRVDVLEMAVIPHILGEGIPLFPPGTPELKLDLVLAQPWRNGAMHLKYTRRST